MKARENDIFWKLNANNRCLFFEILIWIQYFGRLRFLTFSNCVSLFIDSSRDAIKVLYIYVERRLKNICKIPLMLFTLVKYEKIGSPFLKENSTSIILKASIWSRISYRYSFLSFAILKQPNQMITRLSKSSNYTIFFIRKHSTTRAFCSRSNSSINIFSNISHSK